MPCLCRVRRLTHIGKANSEAQRADCRLRAMRKTKLQHRATRKAELYKETHLKGKVFDSMFAREVLQLCPLLAVCLCNLSGASDVLQGRPSQERGFHDSSQLEMALAMGCVQCFVTNQLGNGVGPFTCGMIATVRVCSYMSQVLQLLTTFAVATNFCSMRYADCTSICWKAKAHGAR